MQRYYAARAPEYDRIYQKPERQLDLAALRLWLPPLFAGTYLLEIACGTGYWTQFIAPATATVLAIDAAPLAVPSAPNSKVARLASRHRRPLCYQPLL